MAKKKATDKITTPKGILQKYVNLEVPNQKYDVYKADLLIEGDMADKFEDYLNRLKKYAEIRFDSDDIYVPAKRVDAGLIVTVKNKSHFVNKKGEKIDLAPRIFDAKNRVVTELLNIGEGSTVRIQLSPYFWEANGGGFTLQPSAVQIIDLKKYVAGGQSPFEEEEGFEAKSDGVFDDDDFADEAPVKTDTVDDDGDVPF